jgi:hypothetical protein
VHAVTGGGQIPAIFLSLHHNLTAGGVMTRLFLTFPILLMAAAAMAEDARLSMPYYGSATMNADDSLVLHFTRTVDGKPADGSQTFAPGDRSYDNVRRHLSGIEPGQTKPLTPWRD